LFFNEIFLFETFMKDRETAAGVPFGGGGVSFKGCGGDGPTKGLWLESIGKADALGIR
jgi:hypothetical protein